jgi:hypothetical protein
MKQIEGRLKKLESDRATLAGPIEVQAFEHDLITGLYRSYKTNLTYTEDQLEGLRPPGCPASEVWCIIVEYTEMKQID